MEDTAIVEQDQTIFRTEDLLKVYGDGDAAVYALRGVNLTVHEGEIVVLVGPSGSGKSTLLNILGGLDSASEGHVWFRDKDLTEFNRSALTQYRRHHIGFVFQFYNLMPGLTARENVALVTEIADNPMGPDEALSLVGLSHRLDHFPAELSGGEQQRVAIARAIAKRPTILFCDEPTGALDSVTSHQVMEALENVNRQLNTTMLIVTHNPDLARLGRRIVAFRDGKIESDTHSVNYLDSEVSA